MVNSSNTINLLCMNGIEYCFNHELLFLSGENITGAIFGSPLVISHLILLFLITDIKSLHCGPRVCSVIYYTTILTGALALKELHSYGAACRRVSLSPPPPSLPPPSQSSPSTIVCNSCENIVTRFCLFRMASAATYRQSHWLVIQ